MQVYKKFKSFLEKIEYNYSLGKYENCSRLVKEMFRISQHDSDEHFFCIALQRTFYCMKQECEMDSIKAEVDKLKENGYLFEWAYLRLFAFEWQILEKRQELSPRLLNEFLRIEEILSNYEFESQKSRLEKVKNGINHQYECMFSRNNSPRDYLNMFCRIGLLVEKNSCGEDNFCETLLDTLIEVTRSERGAIFLLDRNRLTLVSARDFDDRTLNDAKRLSRSIIKKSIKEDNTVISADALCDPRFKKSKSIMLNRIRSVMCTPLRVNGGTIGAIYLDSRKSMSLFQNELKKPIVAVASLCAAIIEKSEEFKKIREQSVFLHAGFLDNNSECDLVGSSEAVKQLRREIDRTARTDSTVLITGETGSGKSLTARLIHTRSARRHNRFVVVNCACIPESLFESELYGHMKGSFTGAISNKKGLIEEAEGGSIFLDEISNTPLPIQAKLLDTLETKMIRRLGDNVERRIDVRIVCSSNKDLRQLMKEHRFRDDLFYRISVLTTYIPPLRERPIDIPILADHFLQKHATNMNRHIVGFAKSAIKKMLMYSWPGNVRELQNVIERAVLLNNHRDISADDFVFNESKGIVDRSTIDKQKIQHALEATKGNKSLAAKILGVTRRTFYKYMKKYKLYYSH
jgi:transcriptional regulator with GAF, ATPase, and Fis domain